MQPVSRSWLRKLLGAAALDVGPLLRHRDFRLLFIGQSISFFGGMIRFVALPYQIFTLTHSSLAVGLLGPAELVPILALAFLGGALADAADRRALVRATEVGLAVFSIALLINSLQARPSLWLLYAAMAGMAGLDSLQRPALDALLPRLVDRRELVSAGILNSLRFTAGQVAGPAAAGLLIAGIGLPATYGVDIASFVVSLIALSLMRAVPPPPDAQRPSLRRVVEGLRYAGSRPELIGTYVVDFVAMFFGVPMALFPAIAARYGGPGVLGIMYTAPAVGYLLAVSTSGWARNVHRHGRAILMAAAAWGTAIIAFGLAASLPLALASLAVAGGADEISGIFRSAIWNQTIPDSLRGRLAGIELVSYSSGPALGDLEAGAVAAIFSVRASVISGGIFCVLGVAALAVALPAFRRYDNREDARPLTPATRPSEGSIWAE